MRNTNGQIFYQNGSSENTLVDAHHISKNPKSFSPAQVEFMSVVKFHEVHDLSASLKLVHDIALYHSDYPLNQVEKSALYDVKILLEQLEKMGKSV